LLISNITVIISIEATCEDELVHTGEERNVYRNLDVKQGEGKYMPTTSEFKIKFCL